MTRYLAEGEPVQDIHTKQIGRVKHIRSNGRLLVRWQDGSETLAQLSDLQLTPGARRGRRLNLKDE